MLRYTKIDETLCLEPLQRVATGAEALVKPRRMNARLAQILYALVIFDTVSTTYWQKYAPGDYNPLVNWAFLLSPPLACLAILAIVGVVLAWLGSRGWPWFKWPLTIAVMMQAYVVLSEVRALFVIF